MAESLSIPRSRPSNPGQDFETLRTRGLEVIRQVSAALWTDHNEHDPGITTLEVLCYALTELSFRADLPIEVLLGGLQDGGDGRVTALYPPSRILPTAPVTACDWRRLLVDRIPGCGNAWLIPVGAADGPVDGQWTIDLYLSDPRASDAVFRASARRRARRLFTRFRSIGQDVVGVRALKGIPVTLAGTVTLAPDARPEAVLARLYYSVGLFLAPEVRRGDPDPGSPIDRTRADVATGPRLRGGAMSDDDLGPRRTILSATDVARVARDIAGVTHVLDIDARVPAARVTAAHTPDWTVPSGCVLRLDFPPHAGASGIRLLRSGVECRPNLDIARSEFDRLWTEHRRTHPTAPAPAPRPRDGQADLAAYHSIQEDFPAVYGINARGLPADASPARRAQAHQFKGYLAIFEQLLADEFARLAGVPELFTTGRGRPRLFQSLEGRVPEIAPVLAPAYGRELPTVVAATDRALERRNRALDVMLATYGEALDMVPPSAREQQVAEEPLLAAQIRAKRALLRRLPWLGARRGCGLDYLAASERSRDMAAAVKSRIQLGMAPLPRPLHALLNDARIRLVGSAPPQQRAVMLQHGESIDATFEPIDHLPAPTGERGHEWPISDDLLLAAGALHHYRIGRLPGQSTLTVVCRAPEQPIWQLVGHYADRAAALSTVSHLLHAVHRLEPHLRRLAVVEHALLRFGRTDRDSVVDDPLTVTAVVALPAREASDAAMRAQVRRVIRENTPAHVAVDLLFLRFSHVIEFEALYDAWRAALRRRGRPLMEACSALSAFLRSGRT